MDYKELELEAYKAGNVQLARWYAEQATLEENYREGYQKGYAKGNAAGYAEGYKDGLNDAA